MNTSEQASISRRRLLQAGSAAAASAAMYRAAAQVVGANERVRVGVMGVSGRGQSLGAGFAGLDRAEVAWVCDVDERNVAKAADAIGKKQARAPQGTKDFRTILDDRTVDALVIAAPDHWHAPAAILACAAGKHAYVEKPCSHNAREGAWLAEAAARFRKQVQHGTQRRSWPGIQEAMQQLREGRIGRVLFAKCFYYNTRGTIGRGKQVAPPAWLDWTLWQGPAPERPYKDNYVHYNWHWFWHWGTSESGNNGVHFVDLARWGLGVDHAVRISSTGGKQRYPDDDQETPDTNVTAFEFANGTYITWEGRSWLGKSPADPPCDVAFFGEKGSLVINGSGYVVNDPAGKPVGKASTTSGGDGVHLENFISAIREGTPLSAPIDQGHRSALLCHLANIAYRTNGALRFDAEKMQIAGDPAAANLWGREYREEWAARLKAAGCAI